MNFLRVGIVGIGATVAIVHHSPFLEAVNQVDQVGILFGLANEGRFQKLFGCRPLFLCLANTSRKLH